MGSLAPKMQIQNHTTPTNLCPRDKEKLVYVVSLQLGRGRKLQLHKHLFLQTPVPLQLSLSAFPVTTISVDFSTSETQLSEAF